MESPRRRNPGIPSQSSFKINLRGEAAETSSRTPYSKGTTSAVPQTRSCFFEKINPRRTRAPPVGRTDNSPGWSRLDDGILGYRPNHLSKSIHAAKPRKHPATRLATRARPWSYRKRALVLRKTKPPGARTMGARLKNTPPLFSARGVLSRARRGDPSGRGAIVVGRSWLGSHSKRDEWPILLSARHSDQAWAGVHLNGLGCGALFLRPGGVEVRCS